MLKNKTLDKVYYCRTNTLTSYCTNILCLAKHASIFPMELKHNSRWETLKALKGWKRDKLSNCTIPLFFIIENNINVHAISL